MFLSKAERLKRWFKWWSVTREKGMMRFILVYGIMVCGVGSAILFSLMAWLSEPSFNLQGDTPFVLITFSLGGIVLCWLGWKLNEKKFQSFQSNSVYTWKDEMKDLLKVFGWTMGIPAGIVLAGYLVWLTGNLTDEDLNPEVARILAARPQQLDPKENAYFDLIGLNAPEDRDPHTWGVTWVEQAKAIDQVSSLTTDHGEPAVSKELRKAAVKYDAIPCRDVDNCLEQVATNPAVARQVLDREAILLRRYDAILDSRYQEPFREWHATSPSRIGSGIPISLAMTRFALDVAEGRHAEALGRWGRETAFMVRMLEGAHTGSGKMLATGQMHRYHMLLARYLSRHPQAARDNAKLIARLLVPLPKEALDLQPAMDGETAFVARIGLDLERHDGKNSVYYALGIYGSSVSFGEEILVGTLGNRFAKPRATANALAEFRVDARHISTLEGDAYRRAIADLLSREPRQSSDRPLRDLFSYRNPVGKILAAAYRLDPLYFFFRRDGLVADRQLLAFNLDMISRKISDPAAIAEAVKARQAGLAHPFSGELPVWNVEKRQLGYGAPKGVDGIDTKSLLTVSF